MHGWQLDDAFNSSRNKKTDGVESEEEEEVPFAWRVLSISFEISCTIATSEQMSVLIISLSLYASA